MLLFIPSANTDSVDVLKATCAGPSLTTVILVAFETQAIASTVALHVNTAVVPSAIGDELQSSVTLLDELPAVTALVSKLIITYPCNLPIKMVHKRQCTFMAVPVRREQHQVTM